VSDPAPFAVATAFGYLLERLVAFHRRFAAATSTASVTISAQNFPVTELGQHHELVEAGTECEMDLLTIAERAVRWGLNLRGVRSRWLATSLGRVHVYDGAGRGSLPTIVVLHGIGSAATAYAPVVRRLQQHARRVIAPENLGHGFSDKPKHLDVETMFAATREALDELLEEPAVLFGNSLGGAVAIRYALERPERVRGLILSSPAGAVMTDDELRDLLASFPSAPTRAEGERFMARLYHQVPRGAGLFAQDVARIFDRPAVKGFFASITTGSGFSPEELSGLQAPILLLWGRSDRLMPRSGLDYFRAHLPPGTVVVEPEDFGHCPYLEQPARLAQYIVSGSMSVL